MVEGLGVKAHGLGPGQLVKLPGGHTHPGTQGPEALGGDAAHPAKAQYQHPGAVDGDGQVLHGQLHRPLRRGYGVGHRQLLPGEVVVDGQAPGLSQGASVRVYSSAAEELPGGETV